jgi:hypothetical protein
VDEDEAELAKILACLIRNKKILRQAENRASKKALCLTNEIEAAGELESINNCPTTDSGIVVSPAVWSTINYLDEAVIGMIDPIPRASSPSRTLQSASIT